MMRWLSTLIAPITPRKALGNRGEVVAVRYLKKHGYRVLMRNFEAAGGEIDIVARKGDVLVFVEVKTRRSGEVFKPYHQVNQRKRQALTRAARAYLAHYRGNKPPCRFDVISIVWPEQGEAEVEHIANAFEAE
jgi:putative endonuclease